MFIIINKYSYSLKGMIILHGRLLTVTPGLFLFPVYRRRASQRLSSGRRHKIQKTLKEPRDDIRHDAGNVTPSFSRFLSTFLFAEKPSLT